MRNLKITFEDITDFSLITPDLLQSLMRIYANVFNDFLSGDLEISQNIVEKYAADRLLSWALGELMIVQGRITAQNKVIAKVIDEKMKGFKFVRSPYTAAVEKLEKIFKEADYDTINMSVIKKIFQGSVHEVSQIHADAVQIAQSAIREAMKANISREDAIQQIKKTGVSDGYAQNVYRTNTATAVNQATYNKALDSGYVDGFRYRAVGDSRTRQNHLAADKLEQPVDSHYWDSLYPPLGYNCRCHVIPVYAGQLRPFVPATIGSAKPDYPTFGKRPERIISASGGRTA